MCLSWEMTDHRLALKAVKGFHTFAWFTIEACMMFVLYSGIRRRTDRRVGQAAAVVGGEILIFAANGFHCPLTPLARRLGDPTGSVTDIYLPKWFAHNLPAIHVPLIVISVVLHVRNLRSARVRATGGARGHGGLHQNR
jgi:hypothetical protein